MTWKIPGAIALVIGGGIAMGDGLVARQPPAGGPNDADRDAIIRSAQAFADAFNRGDAKAAAATYTENGEASESGGEKYVGRAAIEKAYAEQFKSNAGAKMEILIKSIRFPAKDVAVEEGLLRFTRGPKALPESSAYVVVHSREDGQWKMAVSTETGAGQDRLEDLEWLLGDWATKTPKGDVVFSFARDPKKPVLIGTFNRAPAGKEPLSANIRIALDPETGKIRSWGFEDDGSHSQALWFCDGKSWILDVRAVTADGAPAAERILIQRVAPDAITWRGVDRTLGDASLADTQPLRLSRAAAGAGR